MEGHAPQAKPCGRAASQPAVSRERNWLSPPVGGLLTLWTIGLVLFPIRLAGVFYDTSLPLLGLRPCKASLGAALHLFPGHAALFVLGVALDISQLCVWLVLSSAYFARSSSTRRLMAALLLLGIAQSILPLMVPGASLKDRDRECVTVVVLALWCPYVLLSERVRNTFVQQPLSRLIFRVAAGGFAALSVALCGLSVRSYLSFDPVAFARSSTPIPVTDPRREFDTEASSTAGTAAAFTNDVPTKVVGSMRVQPPEGDATDVFAAGASRLRAAAARLSHDVDHERPASTR